jgi:excisionase family DNA binding protein
MDSDLISTGEAARLCGVTPDAVLKWVKKGKIPAMRTKGGHFRIAKRALQTLGYCKAGGGAHAGVAVPLPPGSAAEHCWDYFRRDANMPAACKDCIVHRARIERCYEVAELGETIGHNLQFCQADCQSCSYYRARKGLPAAVLVVTNDDALTRALKAGADPARVTLAFARGGYETSMLVESFRPSALVLDSALPEVHEGRLAAAIGQDPRLRGTKLIIALHRGERMAVGQGASVMTAPFTIAKIERLLQPCQTPADAPIDSAS